jgi:hypothetical protein
MCLNSVLSQALKGLLRNICSLSNVFLSSHGGAFSLSCELDAVSVMGLETDVFFIILSLFFLPYGGGRRILRLCFELLVRDEAYTSPHVCLHSFTRMAFC